jgi:hypothetical protein
MKTIHFLSFISFLLTTDLSDLTDYLCPAEPTVGALGEAKLQR